MLVYVVWLHYNIRCKKHKIHWLIHFHGEQPIWYRYQSLGGVNTRDIDTNEIALSVRANYQHPTSQPASLSLSLSLSLSIYLSISLFLSLSLSISLHLHLSISLYLYISISLYLYLYLSLSLSFSLYLSLTLSLSISPSLSLTHFYTKVPTPHYLLF